MTIDTQKLLNLFDTAAQAHGWASDQGTRAQAQTALANYQRTRGDLEQALDAQAAEIARLRNSAWVNGDVLQGSQAEIAKLRAELAHLRTALSRTLMALEGYLPRHRNDVTDRAIAVARAALTQDGS